MFSLFFFSYTGILRGEIEELRVLLERVRLNSIDILHLFINLFLALVCDIFSNQILSYITSQ